MKVQLPLTFKFQERLSFDNFLSSNNRELIRILQQMSTHQNSEFVYLWGAYGSGRSHLCQAVYQKAEQHQVEVAYIALSEEGLDAEILEQTKQYELIILDDIDKVIGKQGWDESLFHFYNRVRQSTGSLLMTSTIAPASFESILPDLKSRLGWDLVYQLEELSDADKVQALQQRADERGLKLSTDVGQYLINHLPRDTHKLFHVLGKLDHESLSHKRALTVPFIKKVLAL